MNKCVFALIMLALLFAGNVSAISIDDLQQASEQNTQILAQQNAELTAKITSIDTKVSSLMTTQEMQGLLEANLNITNQIMENFRTTFIITFVVIMFCFVGIILMAVKLRK